MIPLRVHVPVRPVPDDVNDRIRQLMHEPAGEARAAEYAQLLILWREAVRAASEWTTAA